MSDAEAIRNSVAEGYTKAIKKVEKKSCCAQNTGIAAQFAGYKSEELADLPGEVADSSFGCGNPLKFAEVKAGQTVLDIGSGAGIDCFLAAQKVGPAGKVIGLDMTPAMIEQANKTAKQKGYTNVEFRLGTADKMPVEDASVDWIISNCVINLAPDKPAVFREAFRIMKPGGRLSVSDIVTGIDLPEAIRNSIEAYVGCLAGAIKEEDYLEGMRQAGFTNVEVMSRLVYGPEQMSSLIEETAQTRAKSCCGSGASLEPWIQQFAGKVWSAEIKAVKPR
jgi:SAM-dependent methyltransferase